MDDFHWCYEGNCGPEFWETRFEDTLANAQPSQLNFEGYERLRTGELRNIIADAVGPKDDRLNGEVSNNGHTAVLNVVHEDESDGIMTGSADVLGEGQSYQMLQLHFHWGSDDSRGS